jgi:hypothetical protein
MTQPRSSATWPEIGEAPVEQDQPVFRIEDGEAFGDAVDRVLQPVLRRHADDRRLVQLAIGAGDRLQRLFQFARAVADHAIEQDRGLEQVIGVSLQIEAVLDPLHQGPVDLGKLGNLAAQFRGFLGRDHHGAAYRVRAAPKAMPVKVWLICMVPNCSP